MPLTTQLKVTQNAVTCFEASLVSCLVLEETDFNDLNADLIKAQENVNTIRIETINLKIDAKGYCEADLLATLGSFKNLVVENGIQFVVHLTIDEKYRFKKIEEYCLILVPNESVKSGVESNLVCNVASASIFNSEKSSFKLELENLSDYLRNTLNQLNQLFSIKTNIYWTQPHNYLFRHNLDMILLYSVQMSSRTGEPILASMTKIASSNLLLADTRLLSISRTCQQSKTRNLTSK
jgi:hypothetical protein